MNLYKLQSLSLPWRKCFLFGCSCGHERLKEHCPSTQDDEEIWENRLQHRLGGVSFVKHTPGYQELMLRSVGPPVLQRGGWFAGQCAFWARQTPTLLHLESISAKVAQQPWRRLTCLEYASAPGNNSLNLSTSSSTVGMVPRAQENGSRKLMARLCGRLPLVSI